METALREGRALVGSAAFLFTNDKRLFGSNHTTKGFCKIVMVHPQGAGSRIKGADLAALQRVSNGFCEIIDWERVARLRQRGLMRIDDEGVQTVTLWGRAMLLFRKITERDAA